MSPSSLPPIQREVLVSWDPAAAFRRFALEFGAWWPRHSHSIGGDRVSEVVLEPRVGGRIYEEHRDGRRFQWGRVLEWDPPRHLAFTWHPARDPATAQEVQVRFEPDPTGSRVVLTASHWERWGAGAPRARKGYSLGWWYVLKFWAGQRGGAGMLAVRALTAAVGTIHRMRGGRDRAIARAGGEIEPRPR